MVCRLSFQRIVLSAILVTCLAAPGQAAVISVKADGTGTYPTIQAAIDAASPGDEIVLQPGTYTGAGNREIDYRGKAITVRSTNPGDPAVVAATNVGGSYGSSITFDEYEGRGSILAGVTLTGIGDAWAILGFDASPTIRNCTVTGCKTGMISWGDPLVQGCTFKGISDSAIEIDAGAPIIENCTIRDGSLALYSLGGNPTVSRCWILNNKDGLWAAAVGLLGGNLTMRDCLVLNNSTFGTLIGAPCAIGLYGGSLTVDHCTITGNTGGFARVDDADATNEGHGPIVIRNSILWNNPGGPTMPDPAASIAPIDISYSLIEGGWSTGTNVLNVDPQLCPYGRLSPNSPCINAGDPAFTPATGETDIDSQPRVLAGRTDIGADEFTIPGDANADGLVNVADLQIVVAAWGSAQGDARYQACTDFNGDGYVNVADLQILVSNWGKF